MQSEFLDVAGEKNQGGQTGGADGVPLVTALVVLPTASRDR
jgi:hypothetical protein